MKLWFFLWYRCKVNKFFFTSGAPLTSLGQSWRDIKMSKKNWSTIIFPDQPFQQFSCSVSGVCHFVLPIEDLNKFKDNILVQKPDESLYINLEIHESQLMASVGNPFLKHPVMYKNDYHSLSTSFVIVYLDVQLYYSK